ncbi:MAG TPA: aconitase family protein, partial [Anaerolineales bacterium]|nr:aconitase family protein [Anaerolineales bacterium]
MTNLPQNDDVFNARSTLDTPTGGVGYYRLNKLIEEGIGHVDSLPFSIKIMLENALRSIDHRTVSREDVESLANWNAADPGEAEIPYRPSRVILQDLTGVPAVVDLAALRSAMHRMGGDPSLINPVVPVDLVIDHSVQV